MKQPKYKPLTPEELTPEQRECYKLLCLALGGAHHVYNLSEFGRGVRTTIFETPSTQDCNLLTTLVLLAHDLAIRVEISVAGPNRLAICCHKRKRSGIASQRHWTLEKHVEFLRRAIGHSILPEDSEQGAA